MCTGRVTEGTHIILRLNDVDQHLGILHGIPCLDLPDAVHQRLDVGLKLLQLVEHRLALLDELLGHALAETQALTDVGRVIDHVRSVDRLEHEVEKNIFVVNLKRSSKVIKCKNYHVSKKRET